MFSSAAVAQVELWRAGIQGGGAAAAGCGPFTTDSLHATALGALEAMCQHLSCGPSNPEEIVYQGERNASALCRVTGSDGQTSSVTQAYYAVALVSVSEPKNAGPCGGVGEGTSGGCDAAGRPSQQQQGNPINVATGNKFLVETEYLGAGVYPLRFTHFYNSMGPLPAGRALGTKRRHWYERSLALMNLSTGSFVTAMRADGRAYRFTLTAGVWKPEADVKAQLLELKDNAGNTTGWRYIDVNDETETYDASGRLLAIATRAGLAHTLGYDTQGRLESVADSADSFGRALTFTYDSSGQLASMTNPAGGTYTFTYDRRQLSTITYPDAKTKTYHYDDFATLLTGVTDENGSRFSTYAYTSFDRASSSELAGGVNRMTVTYPTGNTSQVTDALGTVRNFTHANFHSVVKNTALDKPCATCEASSFDYDVNGLLQYKVDFNGNRTNFEYDSRGLEVRRYEGLTSAGGSISLITRRIATQWHATYRLPKAISEPFRHTTFTHDSSGNVLTKTIQATDDATGSSEFNSNPKGAPRTWTYTYNSYGQVLTENGPRTDVSDVTTYTYYADNATCAATVPGASTTGCRGQLSTITNALGHITTINEYNAHGQALKITDTNSLVTVLAYDARMRLVSRDRGGEITTFTYYPTGLLDTVTSPDASWIKYSYDNAHRLIEIQERDSVLPTAGNKIIYTLDLMGNRIAEEVFDQGGTRRQKHTRVYNSLNRLEQDKSAADYITAYTYDNQGNLTTINGPLTGVPDPDITTNTYDPHNRLIQVTDAKGGITKYEYNRADQLTKVTDPRNLETRYFYDSGSPTYTSLNLNQQNSPDSGNTIYTYDDAGNLKTSTDARPKVATYNYNALNQVTSITFADPAQNLTFEYGTGAPHRGRLTKITDPSGSTEWLYNSRGYVTRKAQTTGVRMHVTEYTYDTQGRVTSMKYPSGRAIGYTYDGAGRVNSLNVDGVTIMSSVTYHPFGQSASWSWGNGQPHTRTFDQDGRLASHKLGAATRTITYDPASRIGQLDEGSGSTPRQYFYDEVDRLTSFLYGSTNQAYAYDAVGNRTTLTIGGTPYSYTYPSTDNRLSSVSGPTARTFNYDLAGNVTGDGTRTWIYDDRGRMKQVTYGTNSNTYQVNGLGQRVTKAGTGVVNGPHRYVYDEAGRLIGEYDNDGNDLREVVFLGDIPVAVMTRSGQEIVVDNTNPGSIAPTGNWTLESVDQGYYALDYHRNATGSGIFTWTVPSGTAQQSYRLYVRWVADADHATNAPYTIYHTGGSNTGTANQRINHGEWNYFGTFTMGPSHKVELSAAANGVVTADAIKLVPVTPVLSYIHADHLNTPLRVVEPSTNQVLWSWDPAPFGESAPTGTFVFNHRFPGQFFDQETNLHYNYFRDYDPAIGRYIQSDPIGLQGGLNTYAYVRNDPISRVDPEGLTDTTLPPAAIPSVTALCLANPVACGVGLAGAGGYAAGTLIYPIIEPTLSAGIDWICSAATSPSRTERCNTAFKNCMGWRRDPAWLNLCAKSLEQCLNTNLPVIFPNGDIVK